jgi:hypothetical protein
MENTQKQVWLAPELNEADVTEVTLALTGTGLDGEISDNADS